MMRDERVPEVKVARDCAGTIGGPAGDGPRPAGQTWGRPRRPFPLFPASGSMLDMHFPPQGKRRDAADVHRKVTSRDHIQSVAAGLMGPPRLSIVGGVNIESTKMFYG